MPGELHGFFAAASEYERIAALEPNNLPIALHQPDQKLVDLFLRNG